MPLMKSFVWGVALTMAIGICPMAAAANLDADLIQTAGDPSVAAGKFYGYRTPTEGPGKLAFSNALEKAESEGVPLVVIWSNESCHFCDEFTENLNANASDVVEWLSTNNAVFAFFKDSSGENTPPWPGHQPAASYDAWNFVANVCGSKPYWPLVGFYYKDGAGKVVTWRHGMISGKSFLWLAKNFASWKEENGIVDYIGGDFAVSGTECNRYEAEKTTTNVTVEFEREFSVRSATNIFTVSWPSGATVTNELVWASGETNKSVTVDMTAFAPGEGVLLSLLDWDGRLVSTNTIAMLAPENSCANPKWIGEDFTFGEWTVDLDSATNMAAEAEGEAYTLISLQGSMWCPDCANVERNFLGVTNSLGDNAFAEWAASNKVALVSIDIPNFKGPSADDYASPSLLDRSAYATTLARAREWPASGADASLTNSIKRSGLGYLTRKMVDGGTARKYFERNHNLAYLDTANGGFHRPEDKNKNKNRTGVPIFVLLRKDGSVAARLTRMASVSPMASDKDNFGAYMKRFDEMLAVASTKGEHADGAAIEDNHWSTTPFAIASDGGIATNELCHADFQDVYLLDGAGGGTMQKIFVSGATDAKVKVSLIDGEGVILAATNGLLSAGVELSALFPTGASKGYVQIEGAAITDDSFKLENATEFNFHKYEISANALLIPAEAEASASAPAGSTTVVMRIAADTLYKISGISGGIDGELEPVDGDLYRGLVDKDVKLTVTSEGGSIAYQIWRPGAIAFAESETRVLEYAGTGSVTIVRTDGSSGAARVNVKLVSGTQSDGRFAWKDANVEWADGESGEKTVAFDVTPNGIYDEDVSFVLGLEGDGCLAEIADEQSTVTIYDTTDPCFEKTSYQLDANLNFATSIPLGVCNSENPSTLSVKLVAKSGKLPSGLRFTVDRTTGEVALYGVPSKADTYTFDVVLSERRGRQTVTGFSTTVTITVADRSADNRYLGVKRDSQKLPLYFESEAAYILAGELSLAVTCKNKISARYTGTEGKTIAFAGNWTGINEDGVVTVSITNRSAVLDLAMGVDGHIEADITLPSGYSYFSDGEESRFFVGADWPQDASFGAWKGYYTTTYPFADPVEGEYEGTGFLALTMTSSSALRSGTVRYAGCLPDGTAVSGSAKLLMDGEDVAMLPVFRKNGKNCFSAALAIDAGGSEKWNSEDNPESRELVNSQKLVNSQIGVKAMYLKRSSSATTLAAYDVYGSYYERGVSPSYLTSLLYSYKLGNAIAYNIAVEKKNIAVIEAGVKKFSIVDKLQGATFVCNMNTGVFSGKTPDGVYRGILMPGWTRNCECGLDTIIERPFASGFLRKAEKVDGRTIFKTVPVDIDPYAAGQ